MKTKLLIFIFTVIVSLTSDFANAEVAGLCLDRNKCLMIQEAGLEVDESRPQGHLLSAEVRAEIKKIISLIPLDIEAKNFILSASEAQGNFKAAVIRSGWKFNSLKKKLGKGPVFAVSHPRTKMTFILPGFEKLDLRERALIAMSEIVVTQHTASSETARAFKKHLETLLDASEANKLDSLDLYPINSFLFQIGLVSKKQLSHNYLKPIFDRNNNRMELQQFVNSESEGSFRLGYEIKEDKAKGLVAYHPEAVKYLTGIYFHITSVTLRDVYGFQIDEWKILGDHVKSVCKKDPSIDGSLMMFSTRPIRNEQRILRIYCTMSKSFTFPDFDNPNPVRANSTYIGSNYSEEPRNVTTKKPNPVDRRPEWERTRDLNRAVERMLQNRGESGGCRYNGHCGEGYYCGGGSCYPSR